MKLRKLKKRDTIRKSKQQGIFTTTYIQEKMSVPIKEKENGGDKKGGDIFLGLCSDQCVFWHLNNC